MTAAEMLLWLALATGVGALALGVAGRARAAALLARAHAGAAAGALLLVLLAFVVGDLSYRYVWSHVDTTYPLHYRISGLWGGEEGTVLIWGALVALFAVVVRRRDGPLHTRAALALVAFSVALVIVNLLTNGLDATPADRLAQSPRGRGLADILLTPLMVIHPPVQFVAYALIAPIGAYAMAHWSLPRGDTPGGERAWASAAFPWARAAWLFATIGLGLGALWAYYVLSFGGYWAWDPVETSNLLPWLALTAFLHAGKQQMKFGDHAIAAPLLAVLATLLTVFATFATRSGLWVSVHAFTDPTGSFEPDAAARLLAIIDAHLATRLFTAYLLAALLCATALFARRMLAWTLPWRAYVLALLALAGAALLDPAFILSLAFDAASRFIPLPMGLALLALLVLAPPFVRAYLDEGEHDARTALDPRVLMTVAVALFAIGLAVAFVLNLQIVNGPDRSVFDARAPLVVAPLVVALILMLAQAPLGKRGAVALALVAIAASAVAWFAFPEARILASSVPLLVAATVAAVLKLAHVQGRAAPLLLRAAGALLLGAGFLGILLWGNPPASLAGRAIPDAWSAQLGILGVALSAVALVGAIAAFRARGFGVALAGAVAGALAIGYGVGALLALLAVPLLVAQRARFGDGRAFHRREAARLRETGIYLIHLAVVVGLLGYAASTYAAEREVFAATPLGAEVALGDTSIRVADAARIDGARVDRVVVRLDVDGEPAPRHVAFRWSGAPSFHYVGELDVRRGPLDDLFVTPLAFHTSNGWVSAGGPTMAQLQAADVDAVTFSVGRLPLMGLVWAGLWGMGLGMAFVLAGAVFAGRPARRGSSATKDAGDAAPLDG